MSSYDNKHLGLVSGILLLFYGLSGTIFSNICKLFFSEDVQGFLGFMAITVLLSNSISTIFIRKFEPQPKVGISDVIIASPITLRASSNQTNHKRQYDEAGTIGNSRASSAQSDTPLINFDLIEMTQGKKTGDPVDTQPRITCYPDHSLALSATPLLKNKSRNVGAKSNDATPHHSAKSTDSLDTPLIKKSAQETGGTSTTEIITRDRIDPNMQIIVEEGTIIIDSSLTPREILMSTTFWMYAFANVFMQGLTYIANVNAIIRSSSPQGMTEENLMQATAFHLTLISISQSCSRLIFGILTDHMAKLRLSRSILFLVAQSILLLPPILLSLLKLENEITNSLYFCSVFVGIGFGASGGVFPSVMKALFGTKYYGTACSYVLGAVPIGIFASNWTYGYFYDIELKSQQQNGGSSNYCYGSECFRNSFIVTALLQTITVCFAAMMFIFRSTEKRRPSITN
jgi:MFS family permease